MKRFVDPLLMVLLGYALGTWVCHTLFDQKLRTSSPEAASVPRTKLSVLSSSDDDEELIVEETRDVSPAHFVTKIVSFSLFSVHGIDKYETREFEADDYKWRLIIYPSGKENDYDHISVYLAMVETSSLPENWEFNAIFTIFLYNQIYDKYLCFRVKRSRLFNKTKSEWGFPKFISKKTLSDKSSGYFIDDNLVVGANVFVLKRERVVESVTMFEPSTYLGEWKIPEFSKLKDRWTSEEFCLNGFYWKMKLYRKGDSSSADTLLKICLVCVSAYTFATHQKVKADFYTRLIGKSKSTTITLSSKDASHWYTSSSKSYGTTYSSLHGLHNDFIDDCFTVRVVISVSLSSL